MTQLLDLYICGEGPEWRGHLYVADYSLMICKCFFSFEQRRASTLFQVEQRFKELCHSADDTVEGVIREINWQEFDFLGAALIRFLVSSRVLVNVRLQKERLVSLA